MWCTLAICAIWTHLDTFGDIHAIDWNTRWIPYFRLQLRFCVSSRTKPHPGARRLGITGKMLLRGCTVQVWWLVGYAGCGCGRFQVLPKPSPGHEALNAWRDIAEVLECACQQLGQNYSGLMESHLVTKTHSCMRWWWMISSFLTTRTVDVYLSTELTMVCGVCSMSRPPGLQTSSCFETRGILNTCKTEDTRLAMLFATMAPPKNPGHPFFWIESSM